MKAIQTKAQKLIRISCSASKKDKAEYHNSSLRRAVFALNYLEGTTDKRFNSIIEQLHIIIETELMKGGD